MQLRDPDEVLYDAAMEVSMFYEIDPARHYNEMLDEVYRVSVLGEGLNHDPVFKTLSREDRIYLFLSFSEDPFFEYIHMDSFIDFILFEADSRSQNSYGFENAYPSDTNYEFVDPSFIDRLVNETTKILDGALQRAESGDAEIDKVVDDCLDEICNYIYNEVKNSDKDTQDRLIIGAPEMYDFYSMEYEFFGSSKEDLMRDYAQELLNYMLSY